MAMSNFGSFILIVSDQCIQSLMTILAVFHNTTENDVMIHTYIHDYSHLEYLQLLRTLNSNSPINLSSIIPLFWNKLKCNGTLNIQEINHQDKNKLFELQVLFEML